MPAKGYVGIDKEMCKGCNLCVIHCPTECLALNTSDTNSYGLHFAYLVDEEKCIACMNCGIICPDAAVTVYRMRKRKDAAGGAGANTAGTGGAGAGSRAQTGEGA